MVEGWSVHDASACAPPLTDRAPCQHLCQLAEDAVGNLARWHGGEEKSGHRQWTSRRRSLVADIGPAAVGGGRRSSRSLRPRWQASASSLVNRPWKTRWTTLWSGVGAGAEIDEIRHVNRAHRFPVGAWTGVCGGVRIRRCADPDSPLTAFSQRGHGRLAMGAAWCEGKETSRPGSRVEGELLS